MGILYLRLMYNSRKSQTWSRRCE